MSAEPTTSNKHRKAPGAALGAILAALVVLASFPALAAVSAVQDADRGHTQYGRWMFTQEAGAPGGWGRRGFSPAGKAR